MKGGSHNPTISQFSLILIGLVSATVLILTWTKTTSLTSSIPSIPTDSHVMQLRRDEVGPRQTLQRNNSSDHSEIKQVTSPDSSDLEYSVYETNTDNLATEPKKEIRPSILEISRTEEAFDIENKPKQVDLQLSSPKNYSTSESSVENSSDAAKNKDCNYGKGSWIMDDRRPLYSGFDCQQWLSPMWACRLTQRTDFGYEKLRWQPKECKMEDFTSFKFLQRMQDKTLAFVGDSLGRQQFQSLMCMVTGGKEKPNAHDVGPEYGFTKADGPARPSGWAYRFPTTNTTIIYYWSASLCDIQPINASNPDTNYAMHLDRPPEFLRHFLHKIDVLVLNTGHHWNRGKLNANRWIIYVGGVPNTHRKYATIGGAKDFAVHSIVKWVNSELPLNPGLKAFFRSISPRHFFNGEWNTGGTCDNTTPLAGGKEVFKNDSSDPLAADAVQGTGVKLLDITALSELRDEGHISRYSIKATPGVQDCLHWCLPGVPDAWNEILFAQI